MPRVRTFLVLGGNMVAMLVRFLPGMQDMAGLHIGRSRPDTQKFWEHLSEMPVRTKPQAPRTLRFWLSSRFSAGVDCWSRGGMRGDDPAGPRSGRHPSCVAQPVSKTLQVQPQLSAAEGISGDRALSNRGSWRARGQASLHTSDHHRRLRFIPLKHSHPTQTAFNTHNPCITHRVR